MNANELADWLIAYMVDDDDYEEKYMEQIVTMLRQQQAEIEALKADGKILMQHIADMNEEKNKFHHQTTKFARAILRKAQEK